jgi:glutathione S-transferase
MEELLAGRVWFVGNSTSLADVCLFAYTHVADAAGFELGRYPRVMQWIERVKGHPAYVPMDS